VFTIFVSAMVYFLYRFDIGAVTSQELLLKLHSPVDLDYHTAFNNTFLQHLREYALLSVETIRDGSLLELVYTVELKRGADERAFLDDLRGVVGENKVALLPGQHDVVI